MQRSILASLLSLCGAFAMYPSFVWMLARTFNGIDDRWLLTLSQSTFTIPMALAAASIALVAHGLLLNRAFQEDAAEQFEDLRERELQAVAAVASAGGAPGAPAGATVTANGGAPREAQAGRVQRPPKSKTDSYKRRAKSMARRQLRRKTRLIR